MPSQKIVLHIQTITLTQTIERIHLSVRSKLKILTAAQLMINKSGNKYIHLQHTVLCLCMVYLFS